MRKYALIFGAFCHLSFVIAIALMFISIYSGLGLFATTSNTGLDFKFFTINLLLILQFPVLHSFLLTKRGGIILGLLSPKSIAKKMRTTIFSTISALQLILLFTCWQKSGILIFKGSGWVYAFHICLYLASWIYLALAIKEAGPELQTGFVGWYSVFKNQAPKYPKLPVAGLHEESRHPIYLAFALILVTAPTITLDLLFLNLFWIPYCLLAPILKENRLRIYNPEVYPQYSAKTPYMLPKSIKNLLMFVLEKLNFSKTQRYNYTSKL